MQIKNQSPELQCYMYPVGAGAIKKNLADRSPKLKDLVFILGIFT